MPGHIIGATLGPVSSFIRGGQRGRDLWYGSRFLSEATRKAARSLLELDGPWAPRMVMPRPDRLDQSFLKKREGPTISNKILLEVRGVGPAQIAKRLQVAETAAREFLATEVHDLIGDDRLQEILIPADVERQELAIRGGDFLEFYGAWAFFDNDDNDAVGNPTGRPAAVDRALRLLDARKQSRLFVAPSFSRPGTPKSLLDPGRDSVLYEVDPVARPDAARYFDAVRSHAYVRSSDRLDAISLARRRACFRVDGAELEALSFPSLARVAIEPWLEGARLAMPDEMNEVRQALTALEREGRAKRHLAPALYAITSPVRDPGKDDRNDFGFDPELLLENGVTTLLRGCVEEQRAKRPTILPNPPVREQERLVDESKKGENARVTFRSAADTLDQVRKPIEALHRTLGVPIPYVAVLEADGDGVGRLLHETTRRSLDEAVALVKQLDEFSSSAWHVVEKHGGCCWFAGGDELSAYLPVDRVLGVVQELQELFANLVNGETLSFGVAIGHLKDDLRHLRHAADGALKKAKRVRKDDGGGSQIIVQEDLRGGKARVSGGGMMEFVRMVGEFTTLLRDEAISLGLPHGLIEQVDQLADPDMEDGGPHGVDVAKWSVRKRFERSKRELPKEIVDPLNRLTTWVDVRRFANALLLAERIQRVSAQRHKMEARKS